MSKLKKFNKSNGKNNTIKLIVAFLLVAVVSGAISYAVYQKEDEVLFINARVGHFETSSSDIELAMELNGEDIDTPPSKGDGYYNVTIDCDNATGRWDKKEWTAIIGNITSNRVKCNINFETLDKISSIVELGDYISMTPTSTSYTIPISLTGATTTQTINPSELNLWRVIKKNEDGTVEVVSDYISSNDILFFRTTGYMRYIGSLNTIASQYTNDKYVKSTRYMGYSNQIENCTTAITHSNYATCPDDTGYEIDTNLVQKALGTLVGKKPNGTVSVYWIASRRVRVAENLGTYYVNRYVTQEGSVQASNWTIFFNESDGLQTAERYHALRPILTLKSDVKIVSGDGKSAETAYQLS